VYTNSISAIVKASKKKIPSYEFFINCFIYLFFITLYRTTPGNRQPTGHLPACFLARASKFDLLSRKYRSAIDFYL